MTAMDRATAVRADYDGYLERFCNWGRWGDDDNLGTLNYITEDRRRSAARLIAVGKCITLGKSLHFRPSKANPVPASQLVSWPQPHSSDILTIGMHSMVETHIDALNH